MPPRPDDLLHGFSTRTLTHAEWTHEAHLVVCWYAVTLLGADEALRLLQRQIPAFNASIGVANTDDGGYHETLTRYYVAAVAAADVARPEDTFAHPWCARAAPLDHWTRATLFSVPARRGWLPPDRSDLDHLGSRTLWP